MIPTRSEATSKIIDALQAVNEGETVSRSTLADLAGARVPHGADGKIASARGYLRRTFGIHFRAIPKVGLKRLVPGEITTSYPSGFKKAERQVKRLQGFLKDEKTEALSLEQARAHSFYTIWNERALETLSTRRLKTQVEIAVIDGAERAFAILGVQEPKIDK
jgi:hypothetical protein